MSKIFWKENRVLNIETRKGIYIIAQMLKQPYIRFYNKFSTESNPHSIDTTGLTVLFTAAVTRQFLQYSQIYILKNTIPNIQKIDSDIWINQYPGNRSIVAYQGSGEEINCLILGNKPGGYLVKKDLWWTSSPEQPTRLHPSDIFDKIVSETIPLEANEIIDKYELTGLCVFPLANERLYLCYLYNKNVDPYKDLIFNRNLPENYRLAVEIISGSSNSKRREYILKNYFTDSPS